MTFEVILHLWKICVLIMFTFGVKQKINRRKRWFWNFKKTLFNLYWPLSVSIHINLYQNRFINECARKKKNKSQRFRVSQFKSFRVSQFLSFFVSYRRTYTFLISWYIIVRKICVFKILAFVRILNEINSKRKIFKNEKVILCDLW